METTIQSTKRTAMARNHYWFYVLLFTLSGSSGLVYQVIWARKLQLAFGVTAFAISAVLAAFFLGLALGSMIGGRYSDRVKRPLVWYGIVEIFIGIFALFLTPVLDNLDILLRPFDTYFEGSFWSLQGARFLLGMLVLLLPTTLLGATVPLMNRGLILALGHLGKRAATLYAANTLGAVLGVVLAGFFLIEIYGLYITTVIAAAISIVVGCLCLISQAGSAVHATDTPENAVPETGVTCKRRRRALFPVIMVVMGVSGAMGLGLEVVWTRIIVQNIGTTAYVFSVVLALFLVGIALGSLIVKYRIDRWRHLTARLAFCELMVAMFTLLGIPVLDNFMPRLTVGLMNLLGMDPSSEFFVSWIIWASGAMLPISLFLGATWPIAVKIVSTDTRTVGNRIGMLYAANTLGGVIGAVFVGFLLLAHAGIHTTLITIASVQLVLAFILVERARPPLKVAVPYVFLPAVIVSMAIVLFPGDMTRRHMLSRIQGEVMLYREDYYGSIALAREESGGASYKRLLVNGVSYSGTAPYAMRYMRLQGHLPMLMYPGIPGNALVICFGVGLTAGSISTYPDTRITVVELSKAILGMAENFSDVNENIAVAGAAHIVVDDGRNYLLRKHTNRYDIVTLEPPPPNHAGMANLYSEDFYRLVRERLTPDGMVAQWIPLHTQSGDDTKMLLASFINIFPDATLWWTESGEALVLGSMREQFLPVGMLEEKLHLPGVARSLGEIGIGSVADIAAMLLLDADGLRQYVAETPAMTDDLPLIEYRSPMINLNYKNVLREMILYRPAAGRTTQLLGLDPGLENTVRSSIFSLEKTSLKQALYAEER